MRSILLLPIVLLALALSVICQSDENEGWHSHDILEVKFNNDATKLISYSWGDGWIFVWDVRSGKLIWRNETGFIQKGDEYYTLTSFAFSPDEKYVASGSGNGTVDFTASQNTGDARSGSLSIAGQTVTVNQASGCDYAVVLVPTSFRDEGGTALGTVTTAPGCSWTSSSGSSWIVVQSGATGSGPGTATLQIQVNPGGKRDGTVTIAGHSFAISQSKN